MLLTIGCLPRNPAFFVPYTSHEEGQVRVVAVACLAKLGLASVMSIDDEKAIIINFLLAKIENECHPLIKYLMVQAISQDVLHEQKERALQTYDIPIASEEYEQRFRVVLIMLLIYRVLKLKMSLQKDAERRFGK